jgi:hypothetical protein
MSYTLVIVDMQPQFGAAKCDSTARRIIELIGYAKEDCADIIVLEYSGYGLTRQDIRKELVDYPRAIYRTKCYDDGSSEVFEEIRDKENNDCIVCGVNYGACVRDTAIGLAEKGLEVEVDEDGCNQPSDWNDEYDIGFDWESVTDDLFDNGVAVS